MATTRGVPSSAREAPGLFSTPGPKIVASSLAGFPTRDPPVMPWIPGQTRPGWATQDHVDAIRRRQQHPASTVPRPCQQVTLWPWLEPTLAAGVTVTLLGLIVSTPLTLVLLADRMLALP